VPTAKENQLGKQAFSYILDSILAGRATILFSLHTFNCLSRSKNEICNNGCNRRWRLKRYLINGAKVFDKFSTVLQKVPLPTLA